MPEEDPGSALVNRERGLTVTLARATSDTRLPSRWKRTIVEKTMESEGKKSPCSLRFRTPPGGGGWEGQRCRTVAPFESGARTVYTTHLRVQILDSSN